MYQKSILRDMILNGGVAMQDTARLRELLHEQAYKSQSLGKVGTIGGGLSIALGLMLVSINPGALIMALAGGFSLYKGQRNRPTPAEEKEFRFLSRHGRIINLLSQFAVAGTATEDEILSAYESLTQAYLPVTDQLIFEGQQIAVGQVLDQLPRVIAAQQQSGWETDQVGGQGPSRATRLPPSRLQQQSEAGMAAAPGFTGSAGDLPPAAEPSAMESLGTVATLKRTLTQPSPVGLPPVLIDVVIRKPYSTFIVGMSEAGKDILLYNLTRALKAAYPTALFVGIDGKNHGAELPLWPDSLYDRTLHISMLDRPQTYHHHLVDLLKFACEFPGMVLVNFSELNGIAGSYKAHGLKDEWVEVAHYLRYLALQGNAARKFLLSTAQGLTLDELGITTATRGNIQFLMLGNATQFGFINSITANTSVFDRKLISDQNAFAAACSRSTALEHLPVGQTLKGIGFFHTALNRWEPLPRLLNPGADRSAPIQPMDRPTELPETPVESGSSADETIPTPEEMDANLAAAIEIEDLIDTALATLYANPGQQYSLTKLFAQKSQRARLRETLIATLQAAEGIRHKPQQRGAVICHYFAAQVPDATGPAPP